jgi:hypothetical protein
VVLSSKDSYSFSEQQLRDARILVNLKKLNLIKHLDLFLSSLIHILPPETSFIGYFSERKHGSKVFSLVERIMNLLPFFYRPFRNSGRHSFNREQVMELLEKNGFRTIAMKEIRGKTYFLTRSVQIPAWSSICRRDTELYEQGFFTWPTGSNLWKCIIRSYQRRPVLLCWRTGGLPWHLAGG